VTYITKVLAKQGVIIPKIPPGQSEQEYKAKVSKVKLYEDYSLGASFNLTHRLTSEVIATTALWSE
jgi:hypothetical protein